jgi:alkylation response protein AidB-like acyl-CoA dehydrogenase
MKDASQVLEQVKALAGDMFRPRAETTDRDGTGKALAENIRVLADHGFFGLGIGVEYGGLGADDLTRREFTEIVASACGVTAFTQQQLHSGGGFAQSSLSDPVKSDLLPKLASGELLCGVAFSHLRRPGKPIVTASRVDGGFRIAGSAPWVTGWSLLDGFMLGATVTPDGSHPDPTHVFAYVPKTGNEAVLTASPPIELHAMNAADTVEVSIRDLFVPTETVIGERPVEDLRRADYCGISGHVFLPLGCARGSIHYLQTLAAKRRDNRLVDIAGRFQREVDACRREAVTWNGACADMPDYRDHALNARTRAIELAVRAAHATLAATGGTGQMLAMPPQRLMREAAFYTTLAQTPDVQTGTLARLTDAKASGEGTIDGRSRL